MKKRLLVAFMILAMMTSTACGNVSANNENDSSQEKIDNPIVETVSDEIDDAVINKTITIDTENGNFSVIVKGVHEVDWNYKNDTMKIVTIQAEVENIGFSDLYDGEIASYEICNNGVSLLDDEEFELEFYDISSGDDGKYEVGAHTSISSKKRVSLPFIVPVECDTVFIKVNDKISSPIILEDAIEENDESQSVESETENDETKNTENYELEDTKSETTEKFVAQGNTTLMNFLSASSDNGYEIADPNREGDYISAVAKGTGGNYNVRYMVENQHVFAVKIYAESAEVITTEEYLDCVCAMAKSINPNIDSSVLSDAIAQAIASPNEGIVDSDTQFRYDSEKIEISISY